MIHPDLDPYGVYCIFVYLFPFFHYMRSWVEQDMSKNCSFDKNSLNTSMNSKMYQCTLSCIKQKYANLKLMKIMSDKFVVINLE